MSSIKYEKNSKRKANRINLPLKVFILEKLYHTVNWSMTGLSIKVQKDDIDFSKNNFYDATLILDFLDASISLKVKLRYIHTTKDIVGFDFFELSHKNRKILRKYLDLYLDGRLENFDEIINIYHEVDIDTPIIEPVKLSEDEEISLRRNFFQKSFMVLIFMIFLVIFIGVISFYNFQNLYQNFGIVRGNYQKVYPQVNSKIEKIYVKVGERVQKGDVLADLDSQRVLNQINLLKQKLQNKVPKKLLNIDKNKLNQEDDATLKIKKELLNTAYKNYNNAKIQLKKHLITKADFLYFQNLLLKAKENYISYKQKISNTTKSKDLIFSVQNLTQIKQMIKNKKKELELYRVTATIKGKIFKVLQKQSSAVSPKKPIFIIQNNKIPTILVTLPIKYISNITKNTKVKLYTPSGKFITEAKVKQITNKIFDNDINLNKKPKQVFIEVKPYKNTKYFIPFSAIKVVFKRKLWF